jgi:hypothetical protein
MRLISTRLPPGEWTAAYTGGRHPMRKLPPTPNLTAVLALTALADLLLFRVTSGIFLPSHDSTLVERSLHAAGLFAANFSSVLALILTVVALVSALSADRLFPRSMRITVSMIGLFFSALACMGVLWDLGPQLKVHLRISHAFLVLFLAFGIWLGSSRRGFKLGVTLFALPVVLQAFVIFSKRMSWTKVAPMELAWLAHATSLAAMLAAPFLLRSERWSRWRVLGAVAAGALVAAGFVGALLLRFDLVQAVLSYGLHIELYGIASTAERIYAAALVTAYASLAAAIAASLAGSGQSRLAGWGLLLIGVAGAEVASAKAALFTLCGLMALAVSAGSARQISAATDDPTLPPPAAPSAQN